MVAENRWNLLLIRDNLRAIHSHLCWMNREHSGGCKSVATYPNLCRVFITLIAIMVTTIVAFQRMCHPLAMSISISRCEKQEICFYGIEKIPMLGQRMRTSTVTTTAGCMRWFRWRDEGLEFRVETVNVIVARHYSTHVYHINRQMVMKEETSFRCYSYNFQNL